LPTAAPSTFTTTLLIAVALSTAQPETVIIPETTVFALGVSMLNAGGVPPLDIVTETVLVQVVNGVLSVSVAQTEIV
jgi:hypothetical protein